MIEGGIADNVVPADCGFHNEFRNLPGADVAGMQSDVRAFAEAREPAMRAVAPNAGLLRQKATVHGKSVSGDHPGPVSSEKDDRVRDIGRLGQASHRRHVQNATEEFRVLKQPLRQISVHPGGCDRIDANAMGSPLESERAAGAVELF